MSREECEVACALIRKEIKDPKMHVFFHVYVTLFIDPYITRVAPSAAFVLSCQSLLPRFLFLSSHNSTLFLSLVFHAPLYFKFYTPIPSHILSPFFSSASSTTPSQTLLFPLSGPSPKLQTLKYLQPRLLWQKTVNPSIRPLRTYLLPASVPFRYPLHTRERVGSFARFERLGG